MEIHHPLSSLRVTVDASKSRQSRDVVLHFHGAHDIVTAAVRDRFPDAIATAVYFHGLSRAYQIYVGRSQHWMFVKLLAELQQATGTKHFDSIKLLSFSKGYGVFNVLLEHARCVEMIDQHISVDTVDACYLRQRKYSCINPFDSDDQNTPFVDFANLVVMGNRDADQRFWCAA